MAKLKLEILFRFKLTLRAMHLYFRTKIKLPFRIAPKDPIHP